MWYNSCKRDAYYYQCTSPFSSSNLPPPPLPLLPFFFIILFVIFMYMRCQCGVCILYVCTFTIKCDEDDCVSHNMMLTSCSAIWHVKEYPVYTDWNIVFFPPKVVVINFSPTKKITNVSCCCLCLLDAGHFTIFSFCKIVCLVPHVI